MVTLDAVCPSKHDRTGEESNAPSDESEEPLDILDLPPIYLKPTAEKLLSFLSAIALSPPSWDSAEKTPQPRPLRGNPTKWLTHIISSPLSWIADEETQERVRTIASIRLSERCGRAAMPAVTRTFHISDGVDVVLHEPTMDGDNLGLKTWGASYLLAKRLSSFKFLEGQRLRILEVGAGTGLVGIAAAKVLKGVEEVRLTDLPEIVPNLAKNIALNDCDACITSEVLDWRVHSIALQEQKRFPVVLVADPLYSKEHPQLLRDVVAGWLQRSKDAVFVVEFPERELYIAERKDFWALMKEASFELVDEGREIGRDDWGSGENGEEVSCWWGVYKWSNDIFR